MRIEKLALEAIFVSLMRNTDFFVKIRDNYH